MKKQALIDAVEYLDDFLGYVFGELDVPSVSYAVAHKGKVLHAHAFGDAVAGEKPATPETRYRVASNSKMFTAVAILHLQESGRLRLDDTVVAHLPWLLQHKDSRWQQVTVRQLLSHTAGTMRDSSQSGFWSLQYEFPDDKELQRVVLGDGLVFDENTRMKYSNYGYGVLGAVVAAVSGLTYEEYVNKYVIEPLGLTHTTMEYSSKLSHEAATGYTTLTPGLRRHIPIAPIDTKALASATGCMSTPSDLAMFLSQIFSEESSVLSPGSVRELRRIHTKVRYGEPTEQFYGLGFELGEYRGKECVGHGGGFPGQLTQTMMIPEDKLAISVTINTKGVAPSMIAKSILSTLYWFDDHYVEKPEHDLTRFTFRTGHLWGASDNIGYGDTLVCIPGHLPIDFSYAETLKRVDDVTVKIVDTNSFLSPGETITYVFDDNQKPLYLEDQGTKVVSAVERDKEWQSREEIGID